MRRLEVAPGKFVGLDHADEGEFGHLLHLIQEKQFKSILEIGSKYGRTILRFAEILPKNSTICSIDLPDGLWGDHDSEPILRESIKYISKIGHSAHLKIGDSKDQEVISWAQKHSPFDLIFIDADHSYKAVKKDWENYRNMSKIIAFHDISKHVRGEVDRLWAEIAVSYRCESIIARKGTPGIGVVYLNGTA